jgi:hypothetical protein
MLVSGRPARLASCLAAMAVVLIIGCTDPGTPPRLGRPRIAPGGGVYTSARTVTLAANEPGARILYTTDGSDPSEDNGTAYTSPVTVGSNLTLKAVSIMEGWADSPAGVATYRFITSGTAAVATPMVSSLGGTFLLAQTVSMACDTPGATIRYTIDGSTPSATVGAIYTAPLRVSQGVTLKAIAVKSGMTDSGVASVGFSFRKYSWTSVGSSAPLTWSSIAISADGAYIVGSAYGNDLFLCDGDGSSCSGVGVPSQNWTGIAMSPDGTDLAACVQVGQIYVSTNGGMNWSSTGPIENWTAVTCAANPGMFFACPNAGGVYVTMDSGANWNLTAAGSGQYTDVASASDGMHVAACVTAGRVWTTTNPGSAWTEQMGSGIYNWTSICSSSNGQYLAACATAGYIATSSDFGATWYQREAMRNWNGIACSSDGGTLVACTINDDIYLSRDYGATWEPQSAGSRMWNGVAMSADGGRVAACADSEQIWIGN